MESREGDAEFLLLEAGFELAGQGLWRLLRDDLNGRTDGVAGAEGAGHEVDGVGEGFVELVDAPALLEGEEADGGEGGGGSDEQAEGEDAGEVIGEEAADERADDAREHDFANAGLDAGVEDEALDILAGAAIFEEGADAVAERRVRFGGEGDLAFLGVVDGLLCDLEEAGRGGLLRGCLLRCEEDGAAGDQHGESEEEDEQHRG